MPASPKAVNLPKILFPTQNGNIPELKHSDGTNTPIIKMNKPVLYTESSDELFVPPPYLVQSHPLPNFPAVVYADPESVTTTVSDWESLDTIENSIWGAFKAVVVMRGGELLNLGKILSGAGGTATSGATTENLTVQVQKTTYEAMVSDWHGKVYYSTLGGIKAIDFEKLSNTRKMVLETSRQYRIMAGEEVIYISEPETTSLSKVSDFIPHKSGLGTEDVVY